MAAPITLSKGQDVILYRYIAQHVLPACLIVLLVMLGLDLLLTLSNELDAMSAGASFSQVASYVLLTSPYATYIYMPLVLLVGTLMGLGNLANNNELTVMRAAGVSLRKLALGVVLSIAPLLVLTTLLGEYLLPWSQQTALTVRAEYKGAASGKGFWLKEGDSYVYVGVVAPDNSLRNIRRYTFDEYQWQSSMVAKSALYEDGGWVLLQSDAIAMQAEQVVSQSSARTPWPVALSTDLVAKLSMEPKYLAAQELREYVVYLQQAGIKAELYELAFWKKALQPLFTLSLVLVAMSFVFGSQRAVPMGQRVLFGVLTGLGFNYAQEILGPASSIFGFSPVVAYGLPIMVCLLVASWLLRSVK